MALWPDKMFCMILDFCLMDKRCDIAYWRMDMDMAYVKTLTMQMGQKYHSMWLLGTWDPNPEDYKNCGLTSSSFEDWRDVHAPPCTCVEGLLMVTAIFGSNKKLS